MAPRTDVRELLARTPARPVLVPAHVACDDAPVKHRARGARSPVRRFLGWVLVRSPAQLYVKGEETGGRVPWSFILVFLGAAAAGSGIGALAALAARAPVEEWAADGALVGMGAMLAWSVYSLAALLVMWLIGTSPEHVARGGTDDYRRRRPSDRC